MGTLRQIRLIKVQREQNFLVKNREISSEKSWRTN